MTDALLRELFETAASPCAARTGAPLWLHGRDAVWLVDAGPVDVFLARVRAGHATSALRPLFRVEAGELLCGMPETPRDADAEQWGLLAVGGPGNRLLRLDRAHWRALARCDAATADAAAGRLDGWVERLASPLAKPAPADVALLAPNVDCAAAPGDIVLARQQTVWLSPSVGQLDEFCFLGRSDAPLPAGATGFPLPAEAWLEATGSGALRALAGRDFLRQDERWTGLDAYHATVLACLIADAGAADTRQAQRLTRKAANEAQSVGNAMRRLSAILGDGGPAPAAAPAASFPLLAACRLVGGASGIAFAAPPLGDDDATAKGETPRDVLGEIVEASRVRRRQVALKGEWWTRDNGHLLGFIEDGQAPVALLQGPGGYTLHDPARGCAEPLTAALAERLRPFAFVFYRAFGETLADLAAMIRFGSHGNFRDFAMVVAMGVAIGLLGMVTPLATGMLFDSVIPGAERNQLLQLTLALLAGVFASAMFEVTRGFAMLRIEGKMDSAIQSAVWDRLLRLPTAFFRDYSAGDLAMRANGINTIRQALSGSTVHTLLSAVFSVFNLFLLFYYSLKLALLGIALVAVALLFTAGASFLRLRHERKLAAIEGRISGLVFQLLGSVAKLRTTASESRAFVNWATLFATQQEHQFKATMVRNALDVFNSVFPTLANIAIFYTIAFHLSDDKTFSTGAFLAFSAAFGSFLGAMLGTTTAITALLDVVPIYERAKPILQTAPEITDSKAHPGRLSGDIEISHLSFRYAPDAPPILKDISLHIAPGEFVALVGASGSGKSTLLRLLLGFETPTSGALYYDRQDISGIDVGALRRQLGVVLQNGQLLAGDIFTNIIGSAATLTIEHAWEAARQAGIADDIRAMPMGMHTVVSDGGGTLSGGQRQRLLIARAIVNRPRILFFDEATSALDNRAQEMVSASLKNLRATRVVIAHRLSTIVNADRIFVLDGGRLAQTGTYAELIGRAGLFADLARRQIV